MLQPDPRSGEGCNTLVHSGLANVNTRKRLLYRHCYIHVPSLLVQVFTIQSKNDISKFLAEGFKVHKYTAAGGFNPAPDRYDIQEISMDCQRLQQHIVSIINA